VIRWQSGSESGLLKFQVCEARSLSQMQVATRRLKQRIEQWQQALDSDCLGSARYIPANTGSFAALAVPQLGCVTSQARQDYLIAQIADALIKITAILLGLSLIWQIPWNWQSGSLLYVVFVAITGSGLRFGLHSQ
jgi:hypothetical protein